METLFRQCSDIQTAEPFLDPEDDQDRNDDNDPRRSTNGPQPVAAVGDLLVATEDRQPDQGDQRQGHGETDQAGTDEPRARIHDRIAGGHDEPDQEPDHRRRCEEPEVGQPVARLHEQPV